MKRILFFLFVLCGFSALGQTRTLITDRAVVRDSIQLGGRWIYLLSQDSTFAAADHRSVATTKAIKDYVNSISGGGLDDAYISGDTLYLVAPDSTYVLLLPQGADDWGTQVVEKDSTLRGNGTLAAPLRVNRDTFPTRGTLADTASALRTAIGLRPVGTGTAGRLPVWATSSSLTDSGVSDDGAGLISVLGTRALRIPVGTTAQRSSTPVVGEMRRNTTTGYSESYDGTVWRQEDFPTGAVNTILRSNGTNWVSTNMFRVHDNGVTLGATGLTNHPFHINRANFSTNSLILINLSGTEAGNIEFTQGSTSSYHVGKNSSGFFHISENNSSTTGIAYNREINGVNINSVFSNHASLYVKYRAPDAGTNTTSFLVEGSSSSNVFRIENNGNVGIMTTPTNTLHVNGTARITGSSEVFAKTLTGRDSLGVICNVSVGDGLTLSAGSLDTRVQYALLTLDSTQHTMWFMSSSTAPDSVGNLQVTDIGGFFTVSAGKKTVLYSGPQGYFHVQYNTSFTGIEGQHLSHLWHNGTLVNSSIQSVEVGTLNAQMSGSTVIYLSPGDTLRFGYRPDNHSGNNIIKTYYLTISIVRI